MRIGILGAGHIGCALATLGMQHGHEVMLSNSRGPETLLSTATTLGCQAGSALDAANFGDIVVVAVPLRNREALPVQALAGKILIDTCNYYPDRDGQIEALDRRATTTSELLAQHLRGARLVKAFNAILADDLVADSRPAGTPHRRTLPMAGDDTEAKQVVSELMDQFGFDPLDAGTLSESWRFERAKPAYCIRLDRAGLLQKLGEAKRDQELPHGSWRH